MNVGSAVADMRAFQHSMLDVGVGSLIGVLVWGTYWALEQTIENYTLSSGWTGMSPRSPRRYHPPTPDPPQ